MLLQVMLAIATCLAPNVDDAAVKILDGSFGACQDVTSLVCLQTIVVQDGGYSGLPPTQRYKITYSAPNKLRVKMLSKAGDYFNEMVCDGKQYYVFEEGSKSYVLRPLNSKGITAEEWGSGPFGDNSLGPMILEKDHIYEAAMRASGKVEGTATVDNVLCDVLSFEDVTYKSKSLSKLYIARKDKMIRKYESTSPNMKYVETYIIEVLNKPVPAWAFAITPPKGARRVQKFG